MKGIELPINILVVVAIAVIVLLGLVALYFIGFNPFAGTVGLEGVKNSACRILVQTNNCVGDTSGIAITNFDADGDGTVGDAGTGWTWAQACTDAATGDNLASLCACQYGRTSETACRTLCGCP